MQCKRVIERDILHKLFPVENTVLGHPKVCTMFSQLRMVLAHSFYYSRYNFFHQNLAFNFVSNIEIGKIRRLIFHNDRIRSAISVSFLISKLQSFTPQSLRPVNICRPLEKSIKIQSVTGALSCNQARSLSYNG